MAFSFPKASVVIATHNNAKVLRRVLQAMLKQNYPSEYEVVVVNDGSTDSTKEMLQEFAGEKRIKAINFEKNQGVCKARNAGIRKARFPLVANMDHDCIPSRGWLRDLLSAFQDAKVGAVSSFGDFGGTSTAFRKKLLEKVGGYDESYRYYREDTDLTFKIMDLGYEYKVVKAHYEHEHKEVAPKGLVNSVRYVVRRLRYHENDALLYKRHPELAADFLQVKWGFLVSPLSDFRVVANLWEGSSKELKLGSPRGITFIENKSIVHAVLIILFGLFYVVAVKAFRLWGSIKYGKLLI